MRILALDVGDKRIGCAISDEEGKIALGIDTIEMECAIESLKEVLSKYNPSKIVFGLPLTMDGKSAHQAEKVLKFASKVSEITDIPTTFWDERLSTKEAERVLEGVKKEKRDRVIDMLSAQVILQGFLGERNVLEEE
ncbi:MAG: Holliday junction resolvase RuvX [bacterium]